MARARALRHVVRAGLLARQRYTDVHRAYAAFRDDDAIHRAVVKELNEASRASEAQRLLLRNECDLLARLTPHPMRREKTGLLN